VNNFPAQKKTQVNIYCHLFCAERLSTSRCLFRLLLPVTYFFRLPPCSFTLPKSFSGLNLLPRPASEQLSGTEKNQVNIYCHLF
jgi:hypothetical protein